MFRTLLCLLALLGALVSFSGQAIAGAGGCQPSQGDYTFYRTSPPPAAVVGTADVAANGTIIVNKGTPSQSTWTQGGDGQYREVGGDPDVSFCVHDGQPLSYQWKYQGDVISSGKLYNR